MNFRRQCVFFMIVGLLGLSFAGFAAQPLIKDVDALKADEASLVMRKLMAKSLHPLPESILLNTGVSVGWLLTQGRLDTLAIGDFSTIDFVGGTSIHVAHQTSPGSWWGIDFQDSSGELFSAISGTSYIHKKVSLQGYHISYTHRLYSERGLEVRGRLSGGPMLAMAQHRTVNESTSTVTDIVRKDEQWTWAAGIQTTYALNPSWIVGLEGSLFWGEFSDLSNPAGIADSGAGKIDFRGGRAQFFTSLNF